jgi:hypothetical protein
MVIARVEPSSLTRWEPPTKKSPYEWRALAGPELARARIGLIHNPRAGRNRKAAYPLRAYQEALGPEALVRETQAPSDLPQVMRELRASGVNTIVVNGGDGSLGAAITEAYFQYGENELPAFVPLHGGSFNAVARNIGVPRLRRLELLRCLRDSLRDSGRGLTEKLVGTIRLHDPRSPRDVFGFILMAGIPYKLDEYIYATGGTDQTTSLYCLGNMLLGGLLGTRLGKRIFSDTPARVCVDGQDCGCSSFKLTVATTVHRLLPVVAPCPPPLGASQRRFSYLVNFMMTRDMFRNTVKLFMNKYHGDSRHLTGHARTLAFQGYQSGYSLDGEMVEASSGVDLGVSHGVPVRMWVREAPDPFLH